jgi:hypothetical protein
MFLAGSNITCFTFYVFCDLFTDSPSYISFNDSILTLYTICCLVLLWERFLPVSVCFPMFVYRLHFEILSDLIYIKVTNDKLNLFCG